MRPTRAQERIRKHCDVCKMTEDIRGGFIRQRRNLIVISLVTLFAQYADVTLSQLNVFGNVITIGHPIAIRAVLWIAWFYWLVRYFVYYHDVGDKGFWRVRIEQLSKLLKRDAPILLGRHLRTHEKWDCSDGKIECKFGTLDVRQVEGAWRIRITNTTINCERTHGNNSSTNINERDLFVTGKQLSRYQRHAFVRAVVSTRLATEYALPFAIAALPPLYWSYTVIRSVF